MNTFAVVHFIEEGSVEVVPSLWLRRERCYWPPYKSMTKIKKAIQTVEIPASQWDLLPATVIDVSDSYSCARSHLKESEVTSDLSTDKDLGRGKRLKITRRHSSSTDSSLSSSTELRTIEGFSKLPMMPKILHIGQHKSQTIPDITSDEESSRSQQISPKKRGHDKMSEFEKSVLKQLKIIQHKQDLLTEEMTLLRWCLSNQISGTQTEGSEEIETIKKIMEFLPLKDMGSLQSIEDALLDETTTSHLIKSFSRVGGDTADHAVRLLLKKILDDILACQFSFLGTRGKLSFKSLKLCEVVHGSILKSWMCTETDVNKSIMNWLRHAKGRCMNKKFKT